MFSPKTLNEHEQITNNGRVNVHAPLPQLSCFCHSVAVNYPDAHVYTQTQGRHHFIGAYLFDGDNIALKNEHTQREIYAEHVYYEFIQMNDIHIKINRA